MPDTFSVITINYNNLSGLKRTLESVWKQTAIGQIELIVVDGNSNDGSVEFLEQNIYRINRLAIEKDDGIYDAMNKGMEMATGRYLWFVNSGDCIYDPETARQLLELTSLNPGVIYGDTMFTDTEGNEVGLISKLKPQPLPDKLSPGSFRYGMCLCHQSFLVLRGIAGKYDLQYRQAADIDWIISILKQKPVSAKFDGIISRFEIGGSSYQNEGRAWRERFKVLSRHYGTFSNIISHGWIVLRRLLFALRIWRP